MKKSSRILAFVLTLLMVVSLMPVSALADELAPASAAESLLLPGMVDIPAIEETEEPVATETPAPTEAPAETEQPEATEAPVLPELDVVLPEVGSAADAVIGEAAETEEEAPVEDVEEAAEDGATTLVAEAVFASDVHASTSAVSGVFSAIESDYGANIISGAGFAGDTAGDGANGGGDSSYTDPADITSAVKTALNDQTVECVYSYGSHDKGYVTDMTGQLYANANYYVYAISQSDMSSSSSAKTATESFTTWVATTDAAKPIFILSHQPLHERRNDNGGAANWYTAIEAAAGTRDITFFWAHNHTGETSVDTNAYYVAKDGSETFTVEGGSTVTPGFTYMNAGYIGKSGVGRGGVASLVSIYSDSMVFQDYNSSGTYSGTYAHNVTVEREFASSGTTTPTLSSISVVRNKLMYSLGEDLDITVYAIYEGQAEPVEVTDYTTNFDPNTAGVQKVTVSYGGKSTTMEDVIVAAAIVHSDVSIDEYEETASLSALQDGTAEICREWTCYLSNTQTLSLDWEITDNGDGTYTVTCIGPFSEMASEVTYEVNDDTLVLTSVDNTYADEGYQTASKTYTINSDGTLTEAGKGVSYLSISEQTDAYTIGDELYAKILVTREDGSTEYVTLDDCTVTPSCSCGATTVDDLMKTVALGEDGTYHQVTIGYGGKTVNLLFTVGEAVAHEFDTGVIVSVSDLVSAEGTVVKRADTEGLTIPATIENPVAYDITPGEGCDLNPGNYAEITFPIPEGVTNLVVYCVDTAEWFEDIDDIADTYTVRTSHFSTWIIGENTEITVPENETVEVESITGGTTKKTVYVLTSSISSNKEYLIVNGNSAGSYYALANNSGSVAATGVTVKTDDTIGTYIELDDATDELWTVSGSSSTSLKNGSYYLTYSGSRGNYSLDLSTSSNSWTYSNNRLSIIPNRTTYYLVYDSGWDMSSSSDNIYFYVPTEIEENTTVTMKGTYSIEGENVSVAVSENSTAKLTSNLIFTPAADNTAEVESPVDVSTTATYEIVTVDKDGNTVDGDPNDIISKIENGVVTFTGNYGTALVKVSYTTDFGVVTDYITIEATAPYYTIDLCEPTYTEVTITAFEEGVTYYTKNEDGTYNAVASGATFDSETTYYTFSYESITAPVALKGVAAGDTYSVWAVVKEHNAEYPDGEDLGELGDDLTWSISNSSIASINKETGVITFTGTNYGTIQVTVAYEGADGKTITDTITISVTESPYIVPGDGTNDFPEYPNEGAVRFDKTATAVGNYSETGIAMVELSMTGVNYNKGSEIDVVVMLDMSTSMDDDRIAATVAATKTFIDSIVKNEDGSYNANRVYVGYFNGDTVYTITDSGNIGGELASVDNDTEYNALIAAIEDEYDGALTASGTNYDVSLEKCYNVLTAAKTDGTGNDRQQFVVFMSDGGPTDYATSASNVVSESTIVDWFSVSASDSANWTNSMVEEYWSGLMKTNGVTIYSVGLLLNEQPTSGPADYKDYSAAQNYYVTSTLLTGIASGADYFINCESATDTDEMEGIFENIAKKIMKAATNVVVEDKIGSNYTMNFSIPGYGTGNAVPSDALEGTTEFYIQVVEYTLDEDNNRSGNPDVLENFTFNPNGTLKSHTVDGVACSSCSHVTTSTDGVITKIEGTYFTYENITDENDEDYGEYLTWKTAELTDSELALQYFAYLDNSTGVSVEDQIAAGTYYTNEYATLTYTNYLENEVQQKFPVPQMTWNGAQVSYTFYLVNDAGKPVNRAGREVPFAEAVYVTQVFTYHVLWNDLEQSAGLEAKYLAQNLVPDVYALYDDDATYNIHVYEDEEGDNLNNHFVIGGDVTDDYNTVTNSWPNAKTTYVFNNKSDANKYNTVGAYIANDADSDSGTYLCKGDGTVSGVQFSEATGVTADNFKDGAYYTKDADGKYVYAPLFVEGTEYYAITAASYTAADGETQWQPGSGDSTTGGTIIGGYIYYVDENGDVYTIVRKSNGNEVHAGFDFANTTVAFAVIWKPELKEDVVVIDYGLDVEVDVIATDSMAAGVVGVRKDAVDDVAINSGTYVRKEADTKTEVDVYLDDLKIGNAAVESLKTVRFSLDKDNGMQMSEPVKFYYEADVNYYKGSELQTTSMYSSVTVIPATSIYYEDSFVSFKDGSTSEGATTWATEGSEGSAKQGMDRPGPDKIGEIEGQLKDADNVYGYDSAYDNMATYSMGSARYVTVSAANNPSKGGTWPTAEFTFTGTGFDIISLTDSNSGLIRVQVFKDGTPLYSWVVDNYYGYTYAENTDYPYLKYTWTCYEIVEEDGTVSYEWHTGEPEPVATATPAEGETTVAVNGAGNQFVSFVENATWKATGSEGNALYQIPVIKSGENLTYGTYDVKITVMYGSAYDHAGDGSYNFYLDAIRIYNPTGTQQEEYVEDKEAYPTFVELRNNLLAQEAFDTEDDNITGAVFIDGVGNTAKVADYAAYGPNNEVYLETNQAIAFVVSVDRSPEMVMLGVKSLNDAPATITISRVTAAGETAATKDITVNTATDMYYDISDIVLEEVTGNGESYNIVGDGVIVIQNSGANLVSLTNIKTTFNTAPVETTGFNLLMSRSYADVATAYIAETTTDAVVDENTSTGDDVTDDTTGTEGAPGDEESGGDAGDDTGKNIRDTLQNAVSVINRQLEAAAKNIRRAVSGLLARLGR